MFRALFVSNCRHGELHVIRDDEYESDGGKEERITRKVGVYS